MVKIERIFVELENIRKQPILHIHPVTLEALFNHLQSLARGVMLVANTLTWDDFVSARQTANEVQGWQNRATGPYVEMREKGMSDKEIIEKMLDVEIVMWRILGQWQNK